MEALRLGLEKSFDARSATLLARWFEGKGRSDLALELLAQVELRHEAGLAREGRLVLARLFEALDADPRGLPQPPRGRDGRVRRPSGSTTSPSSAASRSPRAHAPSPGAC